MKKFLFLLLSFLLFIAFTPDADAQVFEQTSITSDYGGWSGTSSTFGNGVNTMSSFDIDVNQSGSTGSHFSTDWSSGYWETGSGYYNESGSSGSGTYSTWGSDGSYRSTTIQKSGSNYYITTFEW